MSVSVVYLLYSTDYRYGHLGRELVCAMDASLLLDVLLKLQKKDKWSTSEWAQLDAVTNPSLLDESVDLVRRGSVIRFTARPSGRHFYVIKGSKF